MARHLRSILGDMLVTQVLDSQNPEELPSPEVMLPDPQPGGRGGSGSRGHRPPPCSGPVPPASLFIRCLPPCGLVACLPSILTRHTPPSRLALKGRDLALTSLLPWPPSHRAPAGSAIPTLRALEWSSPRKLSSSQFQIVPGMLIHLCV